jgi:hypothetical protein
VRFKKLALEKLSDKYDIRELKGVHPRLKTVGMTERYEEAELSGLLEHVLLVALKSDTSCKLIKYWPTKRNRDIFQAVVQVDRATYDKLIAAGSVFIGYDHCYVFDAVEILRCYNCNEFQHSSKNCKQKRSCPKCANIRVSSYHI